MDTIEEIKKKRFQFLHKLYELTEGDESIGYDMYEIGKKLDFDEELTDKITQYLVGELLIREDIGIISMLHLGVREVEEAQTNPDKPTYHFPPMTIINVGQMTNSQIQQNSPAATQVVTFNGIPHEEIKKIVLLLEESINQLGLDLQQKSEIQTELQTIETHLSSSKTQRTILAKSFGTIKRIIESAVSSTLAYYVIKEIGALLEKLKVLPLGPR